ncbi:MAG: carboxymuconolactone decarboxylase family protein [Spirochaetaceae bacterium]|nr:carboxymuconolactone decarboxylase family protein [Spirochaetaceae bacterium]
MSKNPLDTISKLDPELYNNISASVKISLEDGALSKKNKLLIAMALDASHGTVDGVRSLALQALANGASKEEIMETIRVTNFISGVGSVYVAANALKDIL